MINIRSIQKIALAMNFILVACSSSNLSSTPTLQSVTRSTESAVPSTILLQSPTPGLVVMPAFSLLPVNIQNEFYDLLKDNASCELPCFLGITPGKTSWPKAKSILEIFTPNNQFTPYFIDSDTKKLKQYTFQIITTKDVRLSTYIQLSVDVNDMVQNIIFNAEIFHDGSTEFYDKHLLKYSLGEVFRIYGAPDNIYFYSDLKRGHSYSLTVVYENLKMVIDLVGGNVKEISDGVYELCPNVGDGNISAMKIALADPSNPTDIKVLIGYPFWEGVPPFEEVAGMSLNNFYELMANNQTPACFEIK